MTAPWLLSRGSLVRLGFDEAHALDVHEFTDSKFAELSAKSRILYATERKPWIRCHHAVDEEKSRLDLSDKAIAFSRVAGPGRRAQPEARDVGEANCVGKIPCPEHRSDGAEQFLPCRRRMGRNVG